MRARVRARATDLKLQYVLLALVLLLLLVACVQDKNGQPVAGASPPSPPAGGKLVDFKAGAQTFLAERSAPRPMAMQPMPADVDRASATMRS